MSGRDTRVARRTVGERFGRRLRQAALVLVPALALYYLVFAGEYNAFDVRELASKRAAAIRRVDSLQAMVDSLVARAESLRSDSLAIERLARERYGFLRPGERLYRFVSPQPEVAAEPTPERGVDRRGAEK